MIQDFFIALPSTAPALNSQHICDPSGFDAEMWHSLELKVTAHLFFTFSNVSTFTLRIFVSEIGSLLHWVRFFPVFPSSGWSSARVEWETYCVISPTCPDVRIQGSGSQVSDIWGGSTIPIQFTFCPFWRQWLNLVNFGKGEQWEANGQTNSPMLSKYIDMFYTHVQLAHKAAMILK